MDATDSGTDTAGSAGRSRVPAVENLRVLVRAPVYAVLSLVARAFPRDRALWVFGRQVGVGEGPWAIWQALDASTPRPRRVWLAQDDGQLREARRRGAEAYLVRSWRGRWLTLRAGVLVLAYGLADVARPFAPGAHIVQTWHGSPLKKIQLDEPGRVTIALGPAGPLATRLMTAAVRRAGLLYSTFPVGSDLVAARIRSAWRWDDDQRIAVVGDPRCDVLHRADDDSRRAARATMASIWGVSELPERMVLWAPTWRDGQDGPRLEASDLTEEFLDTLEVTDSWLVLRAHPLGTSVGGAPHQRSGRIRYASSEDVTDLTAVLDAFDVLITDFSAVAVDFSALSRPIVYLAPDVDEYVASRGLYEDYATFTGGRRVHAGWAEVMEEVRLVCTSDDQRRANLAATAEQLCARYHAYRDGRAAERVVERVLGLL